VKVYATAVTTFAAGHILPGDSMCGRQHGHDWTVRVVLEGNIDPKTGAVADSHSLAGDLVRIAVELDRENLNSMLPAVTPTCEGIALYIRERLLLTYPSLAEVEVSFGSYGARVISEKR